MASNDGGTADSQDATNGSPTSVGIQGLQTSQTRDAANANPAPVGLMAGYEFADPVNNTAQGIATPSTRLWAMVEWLGLTAEAANELNQLNAELIISSQSGVPAATVDAIIQTTVTLPNGRKPRDLNASERKEAGTAQAKICKSLMEHAVRAAGLRRAYARGNLCCVCKWGCLGSAMQYCKVRGQWAVGHP